MRSGESARIKNSPDPMSTDQQLDGGPAFPTQHVANGQTITGMTLRDYFQGQAAIGILQDKRYAECGNEVACAHEIARYAGLIADELLAERLAARASKGGEAK